MVFKKWTFQNYFPPTFQKKKKINTRGETIYFFNNYVNIIFLQRALHWWPNINLINANQLANYKVYSQTKHAYRNYYRKLDRSIYISPLLTKFCIDKHYK